MTDTSQNGEAAIVASCFPDGHVGLVVEIGAWFPVEFSNSRACIERGWDAVLVELSPLAVDRQVREYGYNDRVRIIQAAITPNARHVERFHVTEDALSSDDETQVEKWKDLRPGYHGGFYGHLWVPTLSWDQLKDQFFPDRVPDFVSVDTENSSPDLSIVIMQSDWRPLVMCVEHNGRSVEIMKEARKWGYKMIEMNAENVVLAK